MYNYKTLTLLFITMASSIIVSRDLASVHSESTQKVIIWDLGNTLIGTNTLSFASELGLSDFILYPILEWKNPFHIREIVFSILDALALPQQGELHTIATAQGRVMPTVMCNWLAGKQSGADICYQARLLIAHYNMMGYFSSKRQKRLVERTLETMFCPDSLIRHMYSIRGGLKILRECAEQYDHTGKARHKLYILSNWDPDSFRNLYNSPEFQEILAYVHPDNIVISGDIGAIKPHASIYEHFIKKFNVDPRNCFLIDDQYENIESARKSGMQGFHLESGNYKKLKAQLKEFQIL